MRRFGTYGRVRPQQHYVVFGHRQHPEAQAETEEIDGVKIRSYVIPVVQKPPSAV